MAEPGNDDAEVRRGLGDSLARALVLAFLVTAFTVALRSVYADVIAPAFGYLGERATEPDPVRFVFAIVAAWLVALCLPRTISTLADFSLWVLYVLMGLPLLVVPHFAIATPEQASTLTVATLLSFGPMTLLIRHRSGRLVPLMPLSPLTFWGGVTVLTVACYAIMVFTTSVTLAAPSLTDVYGIRSGYRDLVLTSGPIIGYVVRILSNVLNPLIIARGLYGGPKWLIVVGTFGQFVVYSITGYKVSLLSGVAMAGVALFFAISRSRRGMGILVGALVLIVGCLAYDVGTGSTIATTVFVYRLIILSGTLPAVYAGFFEFNPHVVWSDSFLRAWVPPVYERPMPFVVGQYHTGSPDVTVNSNYVADGLGNLGWWGVAIEAVVLALVLLALSSAARGLSLPFVSATTFTALIGLVNSSPITAILSGGFLLLVVAFALLPRTGSLGEGSPDVKLMEASPPRRFAGKATTGLRS